MNSNFQKCIIEELNETGEYNFILSIPNYLRYTNNKIIKTQGGIGKHIENYNISCNDFCKLKQELIEVFKNFNLGIYKTKNYGESIQSEKWEDGFDLLTPEEAEKFLSEKENWIWRPGKPGYFLAEKGDSNKIEEYLEQNHRYP